MADENKLTFLIGYALGLKMGAFRSGDTINPHTPGSLFMELKTADPPILEQVRRAISRLEITDDELRAAITECFIMEAEDATVNFKEYLESLPKGVE